MANSHPLSLLDGPAEIVAPKLLGHELVVEKDGIRVGGIIVETEAYAEHDEASHSFRGQTARNRSVFGPAGTVYVYFTYGMHHCMNITTGKQGVGEAVLLRAIEPTIGLDVMWRRRYKEEIPAEPPSRRLHNLTNGPAKLTQALNIGLPEDSSLVNARTPTRILLHAGIEEKSFSVMQTPRIGITKAMARPWRWYIAGNAWVSR